jgi:hypothetical protein
VAQLHPQGEAAHGAADDQQDDGRGHGRLRDELRGAGYEREDQTDQRLPCPGQQPPVEHHAVEVDRDRDEQQPGQGRGRAERRGEEDAPRNGIQVR